jgi:hypothetical protein
VPKLRASLCQALTSGIPPVFTFGDDSPSTRLPTAEAEI